MRTSTKRISVVCSIIAILVWGCAKPPLNPDTQDVVIEAQMFLKAVEDAVPNARLQYPEDYTTAKTQLTIAEKAADKRKEDDAVLAAGESIKASRSILQQFAERTLRAKAESLREEIEAKQIQDPDNPFGELLAQVNDIVSTSDRIADKQDIFRLEDAQKIADVLPFLDQTRDTVNGALAETLESDDVSFDRGKYELNEKGMQQLRDGFLARFRVTEQKFTSRYEGRKFVIVIKTVGYTDEQGFSLETKQKLLEKAGETQSLPTGSKEERKFLNQLLSQFRAESINNFLKESIAGILAEKEKKNINIRFEQQIVGKGEEIPPNVLSPYPRNDTRRRICKLFSYILVE